MAPTLDDSKKIYKILSIHHPDYDEWQNEWERYRDVLGDILVDKSRHLPKNDREADDQYSFRVQIAEWIPESGRAIEKMLGALYKEHPKREFTGVEDILNEFIENADRKGNSWNSVVEETAWHLIGYGATRSLINVPAVDLPAPTTEAGIPIISRADEKRLKLRPYVINYTPLAVIDWNVSQENELLMARIKETRYVPPAPGKDKHLKAERFIQYDRYTVTWWDFQEDPNKGEMLLVNGPVVREHGLGMVPIVCETMREVKPMIGHSFIRYAARADIQKFQNETDLQYDTWLHAHPMLKVWSHDSRKGIDLGSNAYLPLDPGTSGSNKEDAEYIANPSQAFEALKSMIESKLYQVYRQVNTDPMGVLQGGTSTFQASGAARAWSFGTSESRILSKIADRMTQVERRIIEIVVRYQTGGILPEPDTRVFKGEIQYPEEFDLSATQTLIDESAQIAQMINSETLLRTIHKRIAASKVGDTTSKLLKEIHDEIDKNPLIGTLVGLSRDAFQMPEQGQAPPVPKPAPAKGAQNKKTNSE